MAKQRMITTSFWSDPWIVDELNPLDRYLFLYLLTNEKTNVIGVYELALRTMSNETGIEKEELLRMLQRLESRVVYHNGWVIFRKATKHQNFRSPKIASGIARELQNMPKDVLQYIMLPDYLCKVLKEEYGMDTVSIGYTSHIALNLTKPNLTKPNLTKLKTTANAVGADPPAQQGKPEINELFEHWAATCGFGVKANAVRNRRACQTLLNRHGLDGVKKLINIVNAAHGDRYASRDVKAGDFIQLCANDQAVMVWAKGKVAASTGARVHRL